jgi:hypothetical protein
VKTRIGASNLAQRAENHLHRPLRRAAPRGVDRVAVEPVLRDIDVETAQVDGAELVEAVINLVEFICGIGHTAFLDDLLQTIENPAIDEGEIRVAGVIAPATE